MVTQAFLVVLWFAYAIIGSGAKNGWTKFTKFKHCHLDDPESKFEFAKFLTVVEIMIYYLSMLLGIRCIYKVYSDD